MRSIAVAAVTAMLALPGVAAAQGKAPDANAPGLLRQWPGTGAWQTFLARRPDQSLACAMVSARVEEGRIKSIAGIRQLPRETALIINDQAAITGDRVRLVVDNAEIGQYPITQRLDNEGPLHGVSAPVPAAQVSKITKLLQTGSTIRFVTDRSSFEFALTGASAGLQNLRECQAEVQKLGPKQP